MKISKKGFTLVELLGVIVIIALIAVIVYPSIKGIIAKQQEKLYNEQVDRYIKVADTYVTDKQDELTYGNDLYITISNLYKGGYIKSKELTNPIDNSDLSYSCVKATWNSSRNTYEYSFETYCPKHIYDVVLDAFPELELGDSGCKTVDSNKNYTYMGGCYLKGEQISNYLWYSGFLWRIMGINQDKTVKLITEENTTSIPYNDENNINFTGSYEDSWLNDYFYSQLRESNIIIKSTFCQGAAVTSAPSRTDCTGGTTISRNVGLISVDELNLANWKKSYLDGVYSFWTMSPYSSSEVWIDMTPNRSFGATGTRPVINIDGNAIVISGDGFIIENWTPYILNEDKSNDVSGNLKDKASVGEYVELADKIYRIVNIDSSGNTKLILNDCYKDSSDDVVYIQFGSDNIFSTQKGIGQVLNTTVLEWLISSTDTTNRNKLVTDYTWYQNYFEWNNSYTISLNETSPNYSATATVGMIRVGEILENFSSDTDLNWNVWTLTMSNDSSTGIWRLSEASISVQSPPSNSSLVRPVIVVKSDTQITSGTGTPSSPYQI